MSENLVIQAYPRKLRDVLSKKFTTDYYQRGYEWQTKEIRELLDDLQNKFLLSHEETGEPKQVQSHDYYFIGSIIICEAYSTTGMYIIDGLQRLTSLTLLLIYLHKRYKAINSEYIVEDITKLIHSVRAGKLSFNLDIQEVSSCLDVLFNDKEEQCEKLSDSELARNIIGCYSDIEQYFPNLLEEKAIPYFIEWLIFNVEVVEIIAPSREDGYAIFDSINNRGKLPTNTDILKGFLLSKIEDSELRSNAENTWKEQISKLEGIGEGKAADFFKTWLKARYARAKKKSGGEPVKDYERINQAYHLWVQEEKDYLKLEKSIDFYNFITDKFSKFSNYYIEIKNRSKSLVNDDDYVYYNALNGFTLQDILLLAPFSERDSLTEVNNKIKLVSGYLDIYIFLHKINNESTHRNKLENSVFDTVLDIRELSIFQLGAYLKEKLINIQLNFEGLTSFGMGKGSKAFVRHFLVRITHHVEIKSGKSSNVQKYLSKLKSSRYMYEIEHNLPDGYDKCENPSGFSSSEEFDEYRNKIGALVLLPHSVNKSLKDKPYTQKLVNYLKENLLAQSLHPVCYENDPPFLDYVRRSGLAFKPHTQLSKNDIDERQMLYQQIAEEVWSTSRLDLAEITTGTKSKPSTGVAPDNLPERLSKPLNQKELAERLKTNSTTIQRRRDKYSKSIYEFCEWTRQKDDLGFGWKYNPETKLYYPQKDCSILKCEDLI
ncbi:MAG TPA: DUF262 domain-containing protein [Coleofasciculaceae cyanobacterium]|jgi:uncharacterized protein with ParB-like and HNH nuclease domain